MQDCVGLFGWKCWIEWYVGCVGVQYVDECWIQCDVFVELYCDYVWCSGLCGNVCGNLVGMCDQFVIGQLVIGCDECVGVWCGGCCM